jgi:putative membrane protein
MKLLDWRWRFMMGYYGNAYDPWFGLGSFIMIIVWILIIVGVVVLVKSLMIGHDSRNIRHNDRSVEILKERYAKGEINKEEFENKKRDLMGM